MQIRPEARPIEFINGRAHFYSKKKEDSRPTTNMVSVKVSSKCEDAMLLQLFQVFLYQ